MNTKKSVLTFLILVAGMIGFAIAQQEKAPAPATHLTSVDAAELDKLATEPLSRRSFCKPPLKRRH